MSYRDRFYWRSDVNWSDELPGLDGSSSCPSCSRPSFWLTVWVSDAEPEPQLPYGEQVVSWLTVLADLAPPDDWADLWHDDATAGEFHRLRGLALSQASEAEAVLGEILEVLAPHVRRDRPAGVLLKDVKTNLPSEVRAEFPETLQLIETAIRRRNRLVHDTIEIGPSWRDGQYVPMTVRLGSVEVSEARLRDEIGLQQDATRAAVMLLLAVDEWRRSLGDE